jgi:benzodiazapine receptor
MKQIQWKALIASLAVSLATGVLAGVLTADSMEKYKKMYRPPLAPPGWLFPVVWTVLFALMGIAAYLVYTAKANEGKKKAALTIYAAQLAANFLWSIIFFQMDAYLLAFAWLILLWYLIFLTIRSFYEIEPKAGLLLIPYLLWVTFAGYLNLAIALYYL